MQVRTVFSSLFISALVLFIVAAFAILAVIPSQVYAQSPPDAPASVTVTRADGTLTASWQAAAGALSYHVTYTDDDAQSWQLAALDHTDTTITITADNDKSYTVGVRAKNAHGGSNWVNSPSAGPYAPPTATPIPAPGPVSSVDITRADGSLTASCNLDDAVSGATSPTTIPSA